MAWDTALSECFEPSVATSRCLYTFPPRFRAVIRMRAATAAPIADATPAADHFGVGVLRRQKLAYRVSHNRYTPAPFVAAPGTALSAMPSIADPRIYPLDPAPPSAEALEWRALLE